MSTVKTIAADHYPRIYLYRRIVQAKLFIDTFYAEKIDLNNISDEAYFSKFHFIRLFKSIYGKTPHQYLISVRIDKARELLQQSKSVSEVCFSVGFESVSSFSGLFTKLVGKTPSQYITDCTQRRSQVAANPMAFVPKCYAFMHGWDENSNFEDARP